MKHFRCLVAMAAVLGVCAAHAGEVIDRAELFQKKQERAVLRRKLVGCEAQMRKGAVLKFEVPANRPQRSEPSVNPVPESDGLIQLEMLIRNLKNIEFQPDTTIRQTLRFGLLNNVFELLTNLRLRGTQSIDQYKLDLYSEIVFLASQEVFKGSAEDQSLLRLLTSNFYGPGKISMNVRYTLLTSMFAGLDLAKALDVDTELYNLIDEWRTGHFDDNRKASMDGEVMNKFGFK